MIERENDPFVGIINGCALAIVGWVVIGLILLFVANVFF